jgi:hypothetical protein
VSIENRGPARQKEKLIDKRCEERVQVFYRSGPRYHTKTNDMLLPNPYLRWEVIVKDNEWPCGVLVSFKWRESIGRQAKGYIASPRKKVGAGLPPLDDNFFLA